MRNNPTNAERIFWYEVLRNKRIFDLKFLRQKILLNYIIDFYCSELLLVIELDGESHLENEEYDKARTEDLENYGIKVIRYFNNDVITALDWVYENLQEEIDKRIKELKSP